MISRIRFEARIECYRRKIGILFSSVLFNLPPSDYGWTELAFSLRIDTSFENFSHNGQHTLAITLTDGRRLACFLFCFRWPRALFEKCSYILIHDATVLLGLGAASVYFDFRPTDWLCMSGTWMLPFSFLYFSDSFLYLFYLTSFPWC